MLDEAAVREALAKIAAPEGGDLVSAGRIRSLVVDEGKVGFAIAAGREGAEAMERMRREAEAVVAALPGAERVLAAVVADEASPARRPPAPAADGLMGRAKRMAGRLGRRTVEGDAPPRGEQRGTPVSEAPRSGALPGVDKVIAVASGKGGVGKSTVSINLALSLAALGQRVGLIDADIYGPSVPTLVDAVGRRPAKPADGEGFVPLTAYGIKVMSIGFLVAPEQAVVWRGPMVTGALSQMMRQTRWGGLDALIVDMPPGTGDIQLSLAQQTPLTGAVVVTTPQDLSLIDVRKAVAMFAAVNVPILGVVENMASFVCPHCGEASDIFGHGGGEREAVLRGVPFLGRVPLTMAIREASDSGRPLAADPSRPEAEAYGEIAANLMAALSATPERAFPRIVFE